MESMNKFKILTVLIIGLFLFSIGAIYSNTKDVTTKNLSNNKEHTSLKENKQKNNNNIDTTSNVQDLYTQITILNARIDELTEKIENKDDAKSQPVSCSIIGIMTDNGIQYLKDKNAIEEAINNENDIVITCSLKNSN